MSIQDLRQNPQDVSNFYLANIYHATINPSAPNISSSLPASPPPFSPPNYAVWVNGLWFLSLVISLTCALLATFLQQWGRRYLKVTHSRYSPDKRARIRAFFAEGVEKCLLPFAVEIMPMLLHISLFLFFAGLVVFLSNVNLTIFKLVLSWVGVCVALYGCITLMPIFRHDSPYYTPLSSLAWPIVFGMAFLVTAVSWWLLECAGSNWCCGTDWFLNFARHFQDLLLQGMQKTVEETALNSPSEIVNRVFMWTFDSLDEDHELERFFSDVPGFRSSKVVTDPLPGLTFEQKWKLSDTSIGLVDRTFSSDLLPAPVKQRRAIICAKAADPHLPRTFSILDRVLSKYQYSGPVASEIVQFVTGWRRNMDEDANFRVQAIHCMIVARVQPHDDSWFILASNTLGLPEAVLRDHAAYGDSLSLAVLIHLVRQQFTHFEKSSWPSSEFSDVLEAASKFEVQDTSPELQNEFCALWTQIVRKVRNDNNRLMEMWTLKPIRNAYISLHQDTDFVPTQFSASTGYQVYNFDFPSTYPVCNVAGHQLDSALHTHHNSALTTFVCAVPHDRDNTALHPSLPSPDPHSSSTHAPLPVHDTLTDASLLYNKISVPVSLQPIDQTTAESCHTPTTSPNLFTTHAIHGSIGTSPGTMHFSTMEPSTPAPPESKASPPDAITAEHTAASRTASDDLDVSWTPLPAPVLDNVLPTGPLLSSYSPMAGSDHTYSSPESHSSMLTPAALSPSRLRLPSAPDLGAAIEGEGRARGALRMEVDALYPSSIHEDILVAPDLPQESASPPPIVADLSHSVLDAVYGRSSSTPFVKPE